MLKKKNKKTPSMMMKVNLYFSKLINNSKSRGRVFIITFFFAEEDEEERTSAIVETDFDFQDFVLRYLFLLVN